jgi:DNA-binding CsgD family transcriptional regulator
MGIFLAWMLAALSFYHLWVSLLMIPVVSMLCLWRAYSTFSDADLAQSPGERFTFPWKPVLIVALYTFALNMLLVIPENNLGISGKFGGFLGALIVFFGIFYKHGSFDFSLMWKLALPLMLVALVLTWYPGTVGATLSVVLSSTANAIYSILIVVILSNMSYRYGVCALWLFSIEYFVRVTSCQLGHFTGSLLMDLSIAGLALTVVVSVPFIIMLMITTLLFFSEKHISSSWGVVLKTPLPKDVALMLQKSRIGVRCQEISQEYGLTQRENEILLMLFYKKKPIQIASDLFIGVSTVRSHIKHIYYKLDIHSQKQLRSLLGIE